MGNKTLSNCLNGLARVFKLMSHISCQIAINVLKNETFRSMLRGFYFMGKHL